MPRFAPTQTQSQRDLGGLEEMAMLKALQPSLMEPMQVFEILARIQQNQEQQQMRQELLPYQQQELQSGTEQHRASARHLDAQTQAGVDHTSMIQRVIDEINKKQQGQDSGLTPEEIARLKAMGINTKGLTTPPPPPPENQSSLWGKIKSGNDMLWDLLAGPQGLPATTAKNEMSNLAKRKAAQEDIRRRNTPVPPPTTIGEFLLNLIGNPQL